MYIIDTVRNFHYVYSHFQKSMKSLEQKSLAPDNSPALQLVSEIFESLKVKSVKTDFVKESNSTSGLSGLQSNSQYVASSNDIAAATKSLPTSNSSQNVENIENMKSRLRKVSKSMDNANDSPIHGVNDTSPEKNMEESDENMKNNNSNSGNSKEKRSSTGSITSLKKLWEGGRSNSMVVPASKGSKSAAKDTNSNTSAHQDDSAIGVHNSSSSKSSTKKEASFSSYNPTHSNGNRESKDLHISESQRRKSSWESNTNSITTVKTEASKLPTTKVKRVWPPTAATETDKPTVPVKPFVMKKGNPIYATPTQPKADICSKGEEN